MADYDSRKIPTLDDVIKSKTADDEKIDFDLSIDSTEEFEAKAGDKEDNLYINEFSATENDIYGVDSIESETSSIESALIDYDITAETETANPDLTDNQGIDIMPQETATPSLQSITDDIVKQLMPDLEKQLRRLINQALKEKLPEDTL